ncbi:MAG: YbaN family protein, partial [Gemmatimonadaceae bacterium]
ARTVAAQSLALPAVSAAAPRRYALLICGTLSLGLGLIGVFVPLLPTTCFLLLAAWCYARSSPRLYDKLLTARVVGPYLQRYRDSRVIPPRVKVAALVMMWITIGYAVLTYPNLAVRLTLLAIAVGVTIHLQKLPGSRQSARAESHGA